MALKATAIILNEADQQTTETVKPDSIIEVDDKTYLNLRPLNGLPSFPVSFVHSQE